MSTIKQARKAKEKAKWLFRDLEEYVMGIGIGTNDDGFIIKIRIKETIPEKHFPPPVIEGVKVLYQVCDLPFAQKNRCTWKGCKEIASHPRVADDGRMWANVCEEHSIEIEQAIDDLDARKLLSAWAKAKHGMNQWK